MLKKEAACFGGLFDAKVHVELHPKIYPAISSW